VAKRTSFGLALETKRFRQSKAQCGPAALKIVVGYFGESISEARVAAACRGSRISGTSGENLVAAARKLGFAAKIVDEANFRVIATWLRKGVPVIVDWMSICYRESARVATGHYSVVSGLTQHEIILEDPAIGRKRRLARPVFMSLWYDFKYLSPRKNDDLILRRMVVVAPPDLLKAGRANAARPRPT
jgi:ABC-type bacteriocin/lantibiotic exporter with double-glycine peptidase domain